jgi:hypothetical protein
MRSDARENKNMADTKLCVIDLETAPIDGVAAFLEEPAAPSNYRDPTKIADYIAAAKVELAERAALSEHTGYTPDELHDYLKRRFLPKAVAMARRNGEIVDEQVIGGSTEKLAPTEYGDYLTAVVAWAREDLDFIVSPPNSLLSPKAEVREANLAG